VEIIKLLMALFQDKELKPILSTLVMMHNPAKDFKEIPPA